MTIADRVAFRHLASSPKDEVLDIMETMANRLVHAEGREKFILGFTSPSTRIKEFTYKQMQHTLVHATSDLASDTRTKAQLGPDPHPGFGVHWQFPRGPGKDLGPVEMTPETADWWWKQTDNVHFTASRVTLKYPAKKLDVPFDPSLTI